MLSFNITTNQAGHQILETPITGKSLLTIPQLNKGTAFTREERETFNLIGKLPNHIETLEEQATRCYMQYSSYEKWTNKNIYMNQLLNMNQVLFFKMLNDHLEEILPIIYTPMVGDAVQAFSQRFFQPRGLYISYEDMDKIEQILNNRSNPEIDIIVASDGEGVLGIGDQGVGAMAIPVAKLIVYTAFAGIDPSRTLPILLDAGTNNEKLLHDPMYLGWRHPRISGKQYDEFIFRFIKAVKNCLPNSFLHWEDFGRHNAYRHLAEYREKICSFNDDIQGTGAAVLAAVISAIKKTRTTLKEQRIVVFGAGTAGIGVTDTINHAMRISGIPAEEARKKFWLIDQPGLLTTYVKDQTLSSQQPYLRSAEEVQDWRVKNVKSISLLETINQVKPTILIGSSAQYCAFTEDLIRAMSTHVEQPIIFPLSNPPERCEAHPQDLLNWSNGKALIATGSPFTDVTYHEKPITISQCNNYLAFPGIGLGVVAVHATRVNDNMLYAASRALGEFEYENQYLLPTIANAQAASRDIAIAVAKAAIDDGVTQVSDKQQVESLVNKMQWKPTYLPYRKI